MLRLALVGILALSACTQPADVPDPVAPVLAVPDAGPIQRGIPLRPHGVSKWQVETQFNMETNSPAGQTYSRSKSRGELTVTTGNSQRFQVRITQWHLSSGEPGKQPVGFSLDAGTHGLALLADFDMTGNARVWTEPPGALNEKTTDVLSSALNSVLGEWANRRALVSTVHQGDTVYRIPASRIPGLSDLSLQGEGHEVTMVAVGAMEQHGRELVLLSYRLRPAAVWLARIGTGYMKMACDGYELLDPQSGWSPHFELACNMIGIANGRTVTGKSKSKTTGKPMDAAN